VERVGGRWTCRANGHIYHEKFSPSKQPGICDVDGSALFQRDDDKYDTVAHRIHVYLTQTALLVDYYRQHGKLVEIDGTQAVEKVTADLLSALEK
jgi:adenylate kinase